MSKVISGHAVSVDGYISGRTPEGVEEFGRGLGDAPMLFDWYFDGDTPSRVDAIAAARAAAGDKDVGLMGGGLVTEALRAGLVDEVILHQVPILLGAGRSFFHELPEHVHLRLLEAIPAPGVTHLRYEVVR
ncbi:dihydrofolate reductase family protein [Allorhizocola rhizosphaerae]|uniref:dihydrofolate reductase family protein n=1 Tax=Allorhizocola rhizosphaerae TaxID=1872709 RepID=UPI000E3CDB52|nr:dihydrofolate reductase family protein [Allorhizocola rhizosphaerae]